ncbi:hypothetical protein ACFQZ4_35040 [Catellatospora coxensis]|uniref:hypothetical protein n=1 Tax=Catellatospora coxensis TaxID=310354 RepID=UPI0019429F2E|nr:hypothetical protein [Catellatospora coxensis]
MTWVEEILRRRRRHRTWFRIVLALAVVTGLVLFFGRPHWQQYQARQEKQARQAALAEYAPVVFPAIRALLGYDYRDFDGAVARGQSFLTGPFAAEYTAAMASLRTTALAEQTVVTADAHGVGVREHGRQQGRVLAYVTQRRTANGLAGVEITYCEVMVTLERVGSGWKVARFVVQPNPNVRISPTATPRPSS